MSMIHQRFRCGSATLAVAFVVLFGGLACASNKADKASKSSPVLFDGTDMAGWKQCGPGAFEVKDGALVPSGGMGMLWHERELGDFILTLEFKTNGPKANSGVFVRFPDPGSDPWHAVANGYEVQIHDTAPKNRTGSVYSVKEATAFASKPSGEWNTYEIKAVGQQYTVKVNDTVVNEFTGAMSTRGFIGLQNHDPNSIVSFRNVRVVELAPASAGTKAPEKPAKRPATKPATQPKG